MKPPPLVQPLSYLPRLNGRIIQLNRERIPPQPQRTRSDIGGKLEILTEPRSSVWATPRPRSSLSVTERSARVREFSVSFFSPPFSKQREWEEEDLEEEEPVAVARQFVEGFYWIAFYLRAAGAARSAACTRSMYAAGALWH